MPVCNLLIHSSCKYAKAPQSLHHTFALEHLQNTQAVSFGNPRVEISDGMSLGRTSAAFSLCSMWESH